MNCNSPCLVFCFRTQALGASFLETFLHKRIKKLENHKTQDLEGSKGRKCSTPIRNTTQYSIFYMQSSVGLDVLGNTVVI